MWLTSSEQSVINVFQRYDQTLGSVWCTDFNTQFLFWTAAGDATVTISHRYTPKEQLCQHTKIADIVVAAAGLSLFACIPNLPFILICMSHLMALNTVFRNSQPDHSGHDQRGSCCDRRWNKQSAGPCHWKEQAGWRCGFWRYGRWTSIGFLHELTPPVPL